MYCIESIVAQNRKATQQGWTEPGTAVGTSGIAPDLYNVYQNELLVAEGITYKQVVEAGYHGNDFLLEEVGC